MTIATSISSKSIAYFQQITDSVSKRLSNFPTPFAVLYETSDERDLPPLSEHTVTVLELPPPQVESKYDEPVSRATVLPPSTEQLQYHQELEAFREKLTKEKANLEELQQKQLTTLQNTLQEAESNLSTLQAKAERALKEKETECDSVLENQSTLYVAKCNDLFDAENRVRQLQTNYRKTHLFFSGLLVALGATLLTTVAALHFYAVALPLVVPAVISSAIVVAGAASFIFYQRKS